MNQSKIKNHRPPYEVAKHFRPKGVCYCDLDDEACYSKGHWQMVRTIKAELEVVNESQKTVNLHVMYDLPADAASRAIRIASAVEMLMDSYPDWSVVNIQISKDADERKNLYRPPIGEQSA